LVVPLKTALALALAWLLCGCSTVRFAYENADTYLRWKASSYLDLGGDDAEELDDRIDEFHAWHRKNELPKYVKLAAEAEQRFADGLSRQDLVWGYDSVRAQARDSLRKGAELIAPLLDRLTPEQIGQIERRIAEENRQYYRDYLRGSERERRKKRAKFAADRLEDWVGKLTQAQVERVREYAERAPMVDELRDRDRRRLQKDIIAMLRARQARARLAERVAHWESGREPGYTAALDAWRDQYFAMLMDIDRTLTPEQRARALRSMRRYAADFQALAAR
jgi:uncharacterized protein DUF6279